GQHHSTFPRRPAPSTEPLRGGIALRAAPRGQGSKTTCFFLITRPPPRSTLFPYTTLFRSLTKIGEPGANIHHFIAKKLRFVDEVDRKSTRLNSSHLVISYAVFCLKKKNQPSMSHEIASGSARMDSTKCSTARLHGVRRGTR